MSNPGPSQSFMGPSLGFCCSRPISSLHTDMILNLTFLMKVVLSATSRLYCVVGDFHMSNDTLVQNVLAVFSTFVPSALNLPVKSHLRSGQRCQRAVIAVRIQTLSVHCLKINLV